MGNTCPTIKVYKGRNDVTINVIDLDYWRSNGWETSADRQSKPKAEEKPKEVKHGNGHGKRKQTK